MTTESALPEPGPGQARDWTRADAEAQQAYWKRRFADAFTANIDRTVQRLYEAYEVEDQRIVDARVRRVILHLSMRIYDAGVEAGVSETLAQGIGMGLDLNLLRKNGPVCPDDGPLNDDWTWDG